MHEGNEVGRRYGYEEDREAVARPMTAEEREQWFHIRQAVPALAYALMGIFDDDTMYEASTQAEEIERKIDDEWN